MVPRLPFASCPMRFTPETGSNHEFEKYRMTTFEKCTHCGEPLTEETARNNKCINCSVAESASRGRVAGVQPHIGKKGGGKSSQLKPRRFLRVPTALPGTLIDSLGSQSVVVTEVSAGGARIRASRRPANDSRLALVLVGAGTIHATLAHWSGLTGGLAFTEDPAEVAERLIVSRPVLSMGMPDR